MLYLENETSTRAAMVKDIRYRATYSFSWWFEKPCTLEICMLNGSKNRAVARFFEPQRVQVITRGSFGLRWCHLGEQLWLVLLLLPHASEASLGAMPMEAVETSLVQRWQSGRSGGGQGHQPGRGSTSSWMA